MNKKMKIGKKLSLIIIFLILFGFGVALYLTSLHYTGRSALCGASKTFSSCDMVLQSKYSEIFNIPVALFGVVFYVTLLVIFLEIVKRGEKFFINIMFILEIFGFLFSILLTYTQIFLIGALCPYCLTSAIVTTTLFFLSLYIKINST